MSGYYPSEDVLRSRAFGPSITRSDNACFDHISMKLRQSTALEQKALWAHSRCKKMLNSRLT